MLTVDAQGTWQGTCPISHTSRNLIEDMLPLGEEPNEGKLLVKELLKLNRVLVVKPHNKTHYELFRGRTPALSFMRPFGCHVTILNTLDYLGKFDRKSHEGFFVEYSLNSKAFRVYNIRTRKVEESLHIRFLEDKPIIAGDGPKWLFDIDVLTKSMNYVPVVAGSSQDYILMPLWKNGSLFDSSLKNASNDEPQPSSDAEKKDDEGVCKESGIADQEKSKNSTQGVNTAGPIGVMTRRIQDYKEQGFIVAVYEGKTHEDLHTAIEANARRASQVQVITLIDPWVDLPLGKRASAEYAQMMLETAADDAIQGGHSNGSQQCLFRAQLFKGEGSTVPVKSYHTPTGAPSTLQPHLSLKLGSSIRQETEVPQPCSPTHTNVADKAASIGVDVRHGGAVAVLTGVSTASVKFSAVLSLESTADAI
ncbi:ribonuclease H-like domain-containing protein [Tanacetum coccineum]